MKSQRKRKRNATEKSWRSSDGEGMGAKLEEGTPGKLDLVLAWYRVPDQLVRSHLRALFSGPCKSRIKDSPVSPCHDAVLGS